MVQLAATIFVAIVVINGLGAILLAIRGAFANAADKARTAKIYKDAATRERNLYSMPMAELDREIARLDEMDRDDTHPHKWDVRYVRCNQAAHIIRGQRKQFDAHPDAKLPDGVKILAELAKWRSTRAYMLKTSPLSADTRHIDGQIAHWETELAKGRKGGPKVGDYDPHKGWRIV